MKHQLLIPIIAILALGATAGAQYTLTSFTIDGGGSRLTGATYTLSGTVGQPDAGRLTGATYTLTGGFWSGAAAPPPCPGDLSGDGITNILDFNILASHFGEGPGVPPYFGDLTGDGFVTIADFNILAGDFGCIP